MLRREIWVDDEGQVTRYNLAYINPLWCSHDGGRILGYDNAHGRHYRHHMGEVTAVSFVSFAQIERRFQAEWQALMSEKRYAKN